MISKEEFIQMSEKTHERLKAELAFQLKSEFSEKKFNSEDIVVALFVKLMNYSRDYTTELLMNALYSE